MENLENLEKQIEEIEYDIFLKQNELCKSKNRTKKELIEDDIFLKQNELRKLNRTKKELIEDNKLYNTDFSILKDKDILYVTFFGKDEADNVFHVKCTDIVLNGININAIDEYGEDIIFTWDDIEKTYYMNDEKLNELGFYDLYEIIKH